ncbi:MAG: DnaB-like helicase C-terminal domain-containing protein [Pseudomonadota bacterium]
MPQPPEPAAQAPQTLAQELEQTGQSPEPWPGGRATGLMQATLPRLDAATLGLRGLMLLAAAPNVGKTALAVQLGLDVVRQDQEACLLVLSLEMPRADLMRRMLCNLSRLEWKGLASGLESPADRQTLATARQELAELGRRILILDEDNFPGASLAGLLERLAWLKEQGNATRALVVVDYLQVFPLPDGGADLPEGADHWRVGAMKRLRDQSGAAVLVISEVDKPVPGQPWASSLSDVRGSSRAVYTPDMIFLLQALSEEEALRESGGDPRAALKQLRDLGLAFQRLIIAKGREGVERQTINLTFFHRQSRYAQGFRIFT